MTQRNTSILDLKYLTSRDEEENWIILKDLLRRQARKIETEDIIIRLNEIYAPLKSKIEFKPIKGEPQEEDGVYKFKIKDQSNRNKIWIANINIQNMIAHELGQFTIPGSEQRYFAPDLVIENKGEEKNLRTILNSQSTFDYCRQSIIKRQQRYQMINLQQLYISHHSEVILLRVTKGEVKVSINSKTYKNGENSRFQTTFVCDRVQKSTNVARLGAHVYHQYIGWDPKTEILRMETHHIDGQNTNDSVLLNGNLILLPQKFHRRNIHNLHGGIDYEVAFSYSLNYFFSIFDLLSTLLYMLSVEPKTPSDIALPITLIEEAS